MPFPSVLNTFNQVTATDRLNNPSHSALHNSISSAIGQVETVIGVEGANSVVGTLQYLIKSPASDGGGHVQSANKGGTGQTSFNKGDILVAQSSSVLTKLAVGTNGRFLTADSTQATGISWAGGNPTVRLYTNASVVTWTKPSTLAYVEVELLGAGGGGGMADAGGGGASAGSYIMGTIPASVLNATENLTIPGSVAGATNGGSASFGAHLVAGGGIGGSNGVSSRANSGTYSGTYISSVVALSSFLGSGGYNLTAFTPDLVQNGSGGDTPYGKGGVGRVVDNGATYAGENGTGYGSGGAGTSNSSGTGGMGMQGLIIVREY